MFQRAVGLARHMDQLARISFPQEGEQVSLPGSFNVLRGYVVAAATWHHFGYVLLVLGI